jgi:UV excision repair protein RAD23
MLGAGGEEMEGVEGDEEGGAQYITITPEEEEAINRVCSSFSLLSLTF